VTDTHTQTHTHTGKFIFCPYIALVRQKTQTTVNKSWTRHFENEKTDCDSNWHKWYTGQGHETVNFGVRRSMVKVTRGRRQI